MIARHVVLAEYKLTTYVYAVETYLQVPLASQSLAVDARLWWMSLGEPAIPGISWADFCVLIIARYGPLPDEEANMPYRDPDIYNDMYMRQYLNYAAEWQAYPNESMGHYCRRFRDAMLPYIPQELDDLEWRAMHIIRDEFLRKLSKIIAYMVQVATPEDDYLLVPIDDAGIPEPLFEGGLVLPEDPIPAILLQKIPPQELMEQQREIDRLREQIARFNQIPRANVVPPQKNPVPPIVPQVPEVHHEIPRNAEVSRMKAPEFKGPTDPIEADNWLIDIQVILDFMRLTEQEKVLYAFFALKKDARHWWMTVQMRKNVATMSWQDFVTEFRTMYYNREILAARQDEFNNFKQGSMTVLEAVKKFE
ncbi:hypothetical protein TIFTF001_031650 [Ficus carica]|uniref:Retrotransposon gag domain-containing protein n=1 Tax=Ficus carica TaxID=3494 RepID=A0AA88DWY2_FICCA|nr:hypothetical protein TIFTF001_031650 [Ficus carica]